MQKVLGGERGVQMSPHAATTTKTCIREASVGWLDVIDLGRARARNDAYTFGERTQVLTLVVRSLLPIPSPAPGDRYLIWRG